jgi:hypothetical protein
MTTRRNLADRALAAASGFGCGLGEANNGGRRRCSIIALPASHMMLRLRMKLFVNLFAARHGGGFLRWAKIGPD